MIKYEAKMDRNQLEILVEKLDHTARSYFNEDQYINANLRRKLCHSKRVYAEADHIIKSLKLENNTILLTLASAILHDIGRFPQFSQYQTYNDSRSENHCKLGVDELEKTKMLAPLPKNEATIIKDAVLYHGVKELPQNLDPHTKLITQIVRDADKLDIFEVVLTGYEIIKNQPEKRDFEIEFPETEQYSKEIINALMQGQHIDYRLMRTMNDVRLLQMAWAFDINFPATAKRIKQRKCLERLFSYLPDEPQIKDAYTFASKKLNEITQKGKPGAQAMG